MISRNERGKLSAQTLDIEIFFDNLIDVCKTESELEWVHELLSSALEVSCEDKLQQIEEGQE